MNKTKLTELQMNELFAQNLRFLRLSQEPPLAQKTLGRILKISQKTIARHEAGKGLLSAHTVYLIANYFNYSIDELLTKKIYQKGSTNFEWKSEKIKTND